MRYDVFISYSYTADELLSERVQAGLARFATPWWRRRALSVFRDRNSLSATPGLWSSIADAIDNSRYFLLLASREAAESPWVAREIEQWRSRKGADGLLILLTDGDIVWDDKVGDFDPQGTTALNAAAFAGCFAEEPRHVDMRWARTEVQLDLTDGRFRDQIAELAAPVRGLPEDELAGEDVHQHRRTLRHAWTAGVALVLVTLVAVTAAGYANASNREVKATNNDLRYTNVRLIEQKEKTEEQRRQTEEKKREATENGELADQRLKDLIAANDRLRAKTRELGQTNNRLLKEQLAVLQHRFAGLAFQLAFRAQHSADYGDDAATGLLLAAQAASFAHRSAGLVDGAEMYAALIEALLDANSAFASGQIVTSPDSVLTAAISPGGQVLATSNSNPSGHLRLRLTRLDGSRAPIVIDLPPDPMDVTAPPAIAFGSDEEVAVLNTDHSISVFDTADGSLRLSLPAEVRPCVKQCIVLGDTTVGGLAFSGSLASGHIAELIDGKLTTWHLNLGQVSSKQVITDVPSIYDAHLSGSRLVVTAESGTYLFSYTDQWTQTAVAHPPEPYGSVSPDGRFLASSKYGHIVLYDLELDRVVWQLQSNDVDAWFSSGGALLTRTCKAMVCNFGEPTIRIRSVFSGAVQVALQPGVGSNAYSSAFYVSRDHIRIASPGDTIGSDYRVTDWPLDVTALANEACAAAGRNLTSAEWTEYIGTSVPYERTCATRP